MDRVRTKLRKKAGLGPLTLGMEIYNSLSSWAGQGGINIDTAEPSKYVKFEPYRDLVGFKIPIYIDMIA